MVTWWLIETTLIVAVLAAVVTAACRVWRCSPAVRHARWLVVLLKMLLPPVVPCPWSPLPYLDEALTLAETAEPSLRATFVDRDLGHAEARSIAPPSVSATSRRDDDARHERSDRLGSANSAAASDVVSEVTEPNDRTAALHTSGLRLDARRAVPSLSAFDRVFVMRAVASLWLIAVLAAAWRQGLAIRRLVRLSRHAEPVPQWLHDQVAGIAAKLGVRLPEIIVAPGIRTPFVCCLARPRLYWPSALARSSAANPAQNPERWRGVIAHELAHLARRDHWVAWLELAAGWLWWWNPVFWYVRSQLRESAELACDAWVVAALPRSRRAYAESLVEVSELVSAAAPLAPVLGVSTGAGRAFQRRLTMILRERVPCKVSWQGLLGVGLLTLVALPSWLIAQSPAGKRAAAADKPADAAGPAASPIEVSGEVREIDAAKNSLQLGGKQLTETQFTLAKSVRVILDDGTGDRFGFQEGKLTDVAEGQAVTVRLSPDRKEVVGIWAEGPSVRGTLKAVDAEGRSITVAVVLGKGESQEEKTFAVAQAAKVAAVSDKTVDDKGFKNIKGPGKEALVAGRLADLPVGAVVTVKLSADQKTAGRIQAEMPSVQGTLKGIDAGKNTLTLSVHVAKGEPATEQTYEVAKDVKVGLDGASGKLSDLSPGAAVTLKLSVNQKLVTGIHAEGPSVQAALKAFDAAANTLTLRITTKGEPEVERTYDLAKNIKVIIDDAGGKLSDVPVDAPLKVKLSANQKVISSIQVEGQAAMGVLTVVDADNRSITITEKQGERTVTVAKDAAIVVDDKPATLGDVPVEASVTVKLSADQKTARGLWAQGRQVQGVVSAVDGVNGEITIDIAKVGEEKFKLAADVQVLLSSSDKTAVKPGKLADVKPEAQIGATLSADQKTVRRITIVEE